MNKILEAQIWTKLVKVRPEISFLPFCQVWFISFPLNCIDDNILEQCLTTNS